LFEFSLAGDLHGQKMTLKTLGKASIKVKPLSSMDVQLFEGQPCVRSTNDFFFQSNELM